MVWGCDSVTDCLGALGLWPYLPTLTLGVNSLNFPFLGSIVLMLLSVHILGLSYLYYEISIQIT